MAKKIKITKGFKNAIFLIGFIGFVTLIGQFFELWTFTNFQILMVQTMVLGIGLTAEGGIRTALKMWKDGLTSKELAHIFTIIIGIIVIISASIGLSTGSIPEQLKGIMGTVYIIALVVIIYERSI